MTITADMVRELREKTGAGMMDCKRALAESGGDADKAIKVLREKGLATAAKQSGRVASEGLIGSYIHMDKIGVLSPANITIESSTQESWKNRLTGCGIMNLPRAAFISREALPCLSLVYTRCQDTAGEFCKRRIPVRRELA